jgi:hypothetical protein
MRALFITLGTLFALALALSPDRASQMVLGSNDAKQIEHDGASQAVPRFVDLNISESSNILATSGGKVFGDMKKTDHLTWREFNDRCVDACNREGHCHLTQCLLPMTCLL